MYRLVVVAAFLVCVGHAGRVNTDLLRNLLLKTQQEMKTGQPEAQPEVQPEVQPEPQPEPCPVYQEVEKSLWKPRGNGILTTEVSLPGVKTIHQQALLDEGGKAISVQGERALPARRECLPEDSRISEDGQFEVLKTVLSVPDGWDASRATVRDDRGVMEISVPKKVHKQNTAPKSSHGTSGSQHSQSHKQHATSKSSHGTSGSQQSQSHKQHASPKKAHDTSGSQASKPRKTKHAPERDSDAIMRQKYEMRAALRDAWASSLPHSLGLEVVDEEHGHHHAPMKNHDAAEGYWDNRGEFQYY